VALSGGTIRLPTSVETAPARCGGGVAHQSGTWVNTILTTELSSSEGNADRDASATLTANSLAAITGSKCFQHHVPHGCTQSFTIRLNNQCDCADRVSYTVRFPIRWWWPIHIILSNSCAEQCNNLAASG
jgi:hypothetical protein